MRRSTWYRIGRARNGPPEALSGPGALALVPIALLGAYWIGGEALLIPTALLATALFGIIGLLGRGAGPSRGTSDPVTGLPLRQAAVALLDDVLAGRATAGAQPACLAVEIDEWDELRSRIGPAGGDRVIAGAAERLRTCIRGDDVVARLDGPRFAVALAATRRADLETMIQLSGRVQRALSEAFPLDGTSLHPTVSIGFCQAGRSPAETGEGYLDAAETALQEARVAGAASVRGFSGRAAGRAVSRPGLARELAAALEAGQFVPWFQPQTDAISGALAGMEALARWDHPLRGPIAPADFLAAIAEAGLSARLGDAILTSSLALLRQWDDDGLAVPHVSINFSAEELADPQAVDRIRWELDRFSLAPDRLTVEVLETVVAATDDDMIVRNLVALSRLGCGIDLDDFGTGFAAIGNIRRFSVRRLKIDRSFVTHVDTDPEQQTMVTAILSMADRLGLDTIAEGVETPSEAATLAGLGCRLIQGFCVARPMPAQEVPDWVRRHAARIGTSVSEGGHESVSEGPRPRRAAGKTA